MPEKKIDKFGKYLRNVLDGSFLEAGKIKDNAVFILLLISLILFYIGNHYAVNMKMAEIDKLKVELKRVKYEAVTSTSILKQMSRQSNVRKVVEEQNPDLKDSKKPPYYLNLE